jgi:hypothetical protein
MDIWASQPQESALAPAPPAPSITNTHTLNTSIYIILYYYYIIIINVTIHQSMIYTKNNNSHSLLAAQRNAPTLTLALSFLTLSLYMVWPHIEGSISTIKNYWTRSLDFPEIPLKK